MPDGPLRSSLIQKTSESAAPRPTFLADPNRDSCISDTASSSMTTWRSTATTGLGRSFRIPVSVPSVFAPEAMNRETSSKTGLDLPQPGGTCTRSDITASTEARRQKRALQICVDDEATVRTTETSGKKGH